MIYFEIDWSLLKLLVWFTNIWQIRERLTGLWLNGS